MRSSRRQWLFVAQTCFAIVLHGAPALAREAPASEAPPVEAPAESERGWLAIDFGLGFALGGDDLLQVEFDTGDDTTLSAGNGVVASLGATVTPLWIGPFGLGASVDLGIKYAGIEASNGSASFTRFPLMVAARALLSIADGWSVLVSGGLHYDLSVSLSGDGVLSDLDLDSDSAAGGVIELGAYYGANPLGLEVTLRYTALEYELGGIQVDASSFGLFGGFHFFVL